MPSEEDTPVRTVQVYSAMDAVEAEVVRSSLEAAGIHAEVVGATLRAGAGELGFGALTAPRVWVAELDRARARTVIEEYEGQTRAGRADLPDWKCPRCGEQVPGNFEVCWNCEAPRPGPPPLPASPRPV
jgi:hypothetical protein